MKGTARTVAAVAASLLIFCGGTSHAKQGQRDAEHADITQINLCNIHFFENAEHKGGEFTKYAGNGNSHGYDTGFQYAGALTPAELSPFSTKIGPMKQGDLAPGGTIEVHFIHTTAQVQPGQNLGSGLSKATGSPQLRSKTQVIALVNDKGTIDFEHLAKVMVISGMYQAPNIPANARTPFQYTSPTTGPSYNEKGSPFQTTWNVRPNVVKVNIRTVPA